MFKIYKEGATGGYECIYDDAQPDLKVVREPKLTMEESAAGTLEFIVASKFSEYSKPLEFRDIVYVSRTNGNSEDIIWAGRVSTIEEDSYLDKTIECYGLLDCLNDIPQPEVASYAIKYDSIFDFFDTIIDYYNSFYVPGHPNRIIVSDVTRNAPYSMLVKGISGISGIMHSLDYRAGKYPRTSDTTFENIRQSFLDVLGGQIVLRHELSNTSPPELINYLDYIDAYDTSNRQTLNQKIEFGKNIVDLKKQVFTDDFYTAIIPYGPTLTDVDKSWINYKTKGKTKVDIYDNNPQAVTTYDLSSGNLTGKFIDSKDGSVISINDSNYVVFPDIRVTQSERYYLSGCLKSIPSGTFQENKTPIGFAILDENGKLLSSGGSVTNETINDVETRRQDEFKDLQITIPENAYILRIGIYFDSNDRVGYLKKYNPFYAESRLSIMGYDHNLVTDPYFKTASYPRGTDVYPDYTESTEWANAFHKARIIYHTQLVQDFGYIIDIRDYDDLTSPDENPVGEEEICRKAKNDLDKMALKVELEIQAVDLSYINHDLDSFGLLDLVNIDSAPHSINTSLPISKIELPFENPEEAVYTLVSNPNTRKSTPSFISQLLARVYGPVGNNGRDDMATLKENIRSTMSNIISNFFSNLGGRLNV